MGTKLFISQPMCDKTKEEILAVRQQAKLQVENLLEYKVDLVENFIEDIPDGATPLWCLTRSLLSLADADIVYFCKGWEQYRGCRIEREIASEYHLHIIDEPDDDDKILAAYEAISRYISYAEAQYGQSEDLTFAKHKLEISQFWLYKAISEGKSSLDDIVK